MACEDCIKKTFKETAFVCCVCATDIMATPIPVLGLQRLVKEALESQGGVVEADSPQLDNATWNMEFPDCFTRPVKHVRSQIRRQA